MFKFLIRNILKVAKSFSKFCIRLAFRRLVVPTVNFFWNKHSSRLPKFLWNNLASPTLDLLLNNVEGFKKSKLQQHLIKLGKLASYSLWDNLIAKYLVLVGKTTASIVSKALFLCMEGAVPGTPMKAASFLNSKIARKLAVLAYYSSYAGALFVGAYCYYQGKASFILASTATFILAPSLAALANRFVMFIFHPGKIEKPGMRGYYYWFISKCDGPFVEMIKAEDAFNFKAIKNPNSNAVIDYYISSLRSVTQEFLEKRLIFIHETEGVYGLIEQTLKLARQKQEELKYENRLSIGDVFDIALSEYRRVEIAENKICYNKLPSIAFYMEIQRILLKNVKAIGYIKDSKQRKNYIEELTKVLAPKVIEKITSKVLTQKTLIEAEELIKSGAIEIPTLELQVWKPSLPNLLINLGRIVGGFANTAGAAITTFGHFIRAANKVFLDPKEIYKPLGLANLREIKGELDKAINKASTGEEAFYQLFSLSRVFLTTIESGLKPFAAALGQSTVDAIILHTPFVAQNEMNATNKNTDEKFVYKNEKISEKEISPEYKEQALKLVEEFWKERGDQIMEASIKITSSERRWFHWLLAAILYPKPTAQALNSAISQLAAGDSEAQLLIDGLRIYFEQSLPELLEKAFLKLNYHLGEVEEFLKA